MNPLEKVFRELFPGLFEVNDEHQFAIKQLNAAGGMEMFETLTKIATVTRVSFPKLAYWYARNKSIGRASTEDLMYILSLGVPFPVKKYINELKTRFLSIEEIDNELRNIAQGNR